MSKSEVSTLPLNRVQAQGTAMALMTAGVAFHAQPAAGDSYTFRVASDVARFLPVCCFPQERGDTK